MNFNLAAFSQRFQQNSEIYLKYLLEEISKNNPNWLSEIEKRVKDKILTKEEEQGIVDELLSTEGYANYQTDWELVKKLFIITEETLEQFKL